MASPPSKAARSSLAGLYNEVEHKEENLLKHAAPTTVKKAAVHKSIYSSPSVFKSTFKKLVEAEKRKAAQRKAAKKNLASMTKAVAPKTKAVAPKAVAPKAKAVAPKAKAVSPKAKAVLPKAKAVPKAIAPVVHTGVVSERGQVVAAPPVTVIQAPKAPKLVRFHHPSPGTPAHKSAAVSSEPSAVPVKWPVSKHKNPLASFQCLGDMNIPGEIIDLRKPVKPDPHHPPPPVVPTYKDVKTEKMCGALCLSHKICVGFVYNKYKQCWLKKTIKMKKRFKDNPEVRTVGCKRLEHHKP